MYLAAKVIIGVALIAAGALWLLAGVMPDMYRRGPAPTAPQVLLPPVGLFIAAVAVLVWP